MMYSLGTKSIGGFLSFVFIINQIYGPGVLAIPIVFDQSGLIPTIFMVTWFLLISSLASTCLAQAIACIPDNREFHQRVEFASAFEFYYGKRWHQVFQICLNITISAYNIASIVICAQSIDAALLALHGETYAFEFGPHFGFHPFNDVDELYSSAHITISVGYLIITAIFMPTGFLNLSDNVKTVQTLSFLFLVVLMTEFVGFFIWRGEQQGFYSVPTYGTNFQQLVSVFIFSWAYVIFVPSWLINKNINQIQIEKYVFHSLCNDISSSFLFVSVRVNEKKTETSVNATIWSAGIISWVGYVAIGWLCTTVLSKEEIALDNVLVSLAKPNMPILTRVTSYLFSLGVIAPGIPVCSVTTRYNLFVGGICSKKMSYFWGCLAPWFIGFVFCQGEVFANLLNWTSLLFNGLVNFLIPFIMYISALKMLKKQAMEEMKENEKNNKNNNNNDVLDISIISPNQLPNPPSIVKEIKGGLNKNSINIPPSLSATNTDDDDTILTSASFSKKTSSSIASKSLSSSTSSSNILHSPLLSVSSSSNYSSTDQQLPPPLLLPSPSSSSHDHLCSSSPSSFPSLEAYYHSPVYPFPRFLQPYAYELTVILVILTQGLITAQIIGDIYWTVKGQNVLGG